MQATGLNYYDLLQSAQVAPSQLSIWLDVMFEKYNTAMWDGFVFDTTPLIGYKYEQFQAELQINVMASYINPDSQALEQSTEGFSLLSGSVPTIGTRLSRDEKEVRDLMQIQKNFGDVSAATAAAKQLFKTFNQMLTSHVNAITYQRNQMVSKGKLEILDTNNPQGLVNAVYSAQIPVGNFTALAGNYKWWTDATRATEGTSADPIKDLEEKILQLNDLEINDITMEADVLTLKAVIKHSKVLQAIGYSLNPLVTTDAIAVAVGTNLTTEQRITALGNILGITIKTINHTAQVEKINKTTKKVEKTKMRSFEANTFTFYPTGNLGTIKHVLPLIPPTNNGGAVAQYFNGSLLSRVYSDINTNVQYFNTIQSVLTVIDKPVYIFNLVVV